MDVRDAEQVAQEEPRDEVQVEREGNGWIIRRGKRKLKRFGGNATALQTACKWAFSHANEHGITAWLLHGSQRSRINFNR